MDPVETLKTALSNTLDDLGQNAKEAGAQIDAYLADIQPEIDDALAESDITSLRYIYARLIAKAGRVSLGLVYRERKVMVSTAMTVLRVLIMAAATA